MKKLLISLILTLNVLVAEASLIVIPGDVNRNGKVELTDAIMALQATAGIGDIVGSDLSDVIVALQVLTGLKSGSTTTFRIPDTGQTKCYDMEENEIDCVGTGQDGEFSINPMSYTKLAADGSELSDSAASWAMVRDNITKLIWEVKENADNVKDYSNPNDADNTYTWYDPNPATNGGNAGTEGDGTDTLDFINAMNAANYGGYSDWRLPTCGEVCSIVDYSIACCPIRDGDSWAQEGAGAHKNYQPTDDDIVYIFGDSQNGNRVSLQYAKEKRTVKSYELINTMLTENYFSEEPTINKSYFPNTCQARYWSSVTRANKTDAAWHICFSYGSTNCYRSKSYSLYVRAVRGGQLRSSDSLVINADGKTATDQLSGLVWEMKEDMDDTVNIANPHDADNKYTWQDALGWVAQLNAGNFAGHSDWRLPNLKELASLVDLKRKGAATSELLKNDIKSSFYWSATTYVRSTDYAWCINFSSGNNSYNNKSDTQYVCAVRGDQ